MHSALLRRHSTSWVIGSGHWPFIITKGQREKEEKKKKKKETKVAYLFGSPVALTDVLAVLEPGEDLLNRRLFFPPLFHLKGLTALARLPLLNFERLLDKLDVLQAQLLTDNVKIANRVDVTLDVDNLGVIEAPHDLEDGIDGANVRQEGIAETGSC